jgi:hypothetical protein
MPGKAFAMRIATTAVLLAAALLSSPAADARGHHGLGRGGLVIRGGFGMHGGSIRGGGAFASDARHANDDHVTAASEEEDRLLNSRDQEHLPRLLETATRGGLH